MIQITSTQIENLLSYPKLISALKNAFASSDITVPLRHHHDIENNTLLLMPAWQKGKYMGVKLVNVAPENHQYNLPSIQGVYLLSDTEKGTPLAMMDAKLLTNKRTAAASALASSLLSRKDSASLLMIGTGSLAPELIKAHANVRTLKTIYVWGRNFEKAKALALQLNDKFNIQAIEDLQVGISKVDIISCATMSKESLVKGEWLREGQHLDLVGSYKPGMRESDDEVMMKANIFVDTFEGATKESGDIVIPIQKGVITLKDIKGDLFDLCSQKIKGRTNLKEITFFKSVGHALEDLVAASLIYDQLIKEKNNY